MRRDNRQPCERKKQYGWIIDKAEEEGEKGVSMWFQAEETEKTN